MNNKYHKLFEELITALPEGQRISIGDLFSSPSIPTVSDNTKKKHLKSLISLKPELLEKLIGFYPSPETIIDLVETRYCKVTESNIDSSNQYCREIVQAIARPIVDDFVKESLADHIHGNQISIELSQFLLFIFDDFIEFSRGAGNGLVSIAGSINELLLIRAMKNSGMVEQTDFTRTGTESEADIVIHSRIGSRMNLGVEVKSYHARERLLRGLQDITGNKVGAGFFKDPKEFNAKRTKTLLQAGPAAIYMPRATLKKLDPDAILLTTNETIAFRSLLYRPLERFVTDMKHFNANEALPTYSSHEFS